MLAVKRFKGTEPLCSTLLSGAKVRQVHKPAGSHSTASLDREHAWSQLIPDGKDGSCDRDGNALESRLAQAPCLQQPADAHKQCFSTVFQHIAASAHRTRSDASQARQAEATA